MMREGRVGKEGSIPPRWLEGRADGSSGNPSPCRTPDGPRGRLASKWQRQGPDKVRKHYLFGSARET